MDINGWFGNIIERAKKYRYAILVVLVGIALMCWPSSNKKTEEPEPTDITNSSNETYFLRTEDLETILSQISGAGEVSVLLTYASGSETVYHQDEDSTVNETSSVIKKDTVILSDASRREEALIRQVHGPVYQGAIVLCKGGDQPSVKLAIVEAVSKATGLGVDDICVLKMK